MRLIEGPLKVTEDELLHLEYVRPKRRRWEEMEAGNELKNADPKRLKQMSQ